MTAVETPKPARPPGPSLRIAIVLVVAGLALAIPTLIAGIVPIARAVTTPFRFEAPGATRVHLGHGNYMVYEDKGKNSIGSAFSSDDSVTITVSDVTVSNADGDNVEVFERTSFHESLTYNGERFVGAVRFRTPAAGDYTVEVRNTGPSAVLVARPFTDTIKSALGWFALAGVGGVIVVVGIILLIVGSVRRTRARSAFAYAVVPPGWHPDPSGSGRLRYWDGYRWTEHLH